MKLTSIIAIYVLFWVMCAFVALPMGIRNAHEAQEAIVPGQEQGAPVNFSPRRVLIRTTVIATILFALYYANYVNGWLTPDMIDVWN